MMGKRFLSYIIVVMFISSCQVTLRHETVSTEDTSEGVIVVPYSEGQAGLRYVLPNTALRFCITAEKIQKERGAFYLYSERYLGLSDVILEDAIEWKIESIEMSSFGVPSAHHFVVPLSVDQLPNFSMTEDGLLLAINDIVDEVKILKEEAIVAVETPVVPYTEAMLLSNSTAKMAQEAANYIYQLRDNKTALITSDVQVAPSDGIALKASIAEIDVIEKQFVSLFAGKETKTRIKKVIEVVPEEIGEKKILFRFSSFNGLVDKDDLSGSPIYYQLTSDYQPDAVTLPDTAGLYFAQPAKINVELYDGRQLILSKRALMSQFGQINCLPKAYLNEKVKMRFYPATGAIKAICKD